MKYKIAEYTEIRFEKDFILVGFGSISSDIDIKYKKDFLDLIIFLAEPKTKTQIEEFSKNKLPLDIIELLIGNNIIVPDWNIDHKGRYARPHLYYVLNGENPEKVHEKVNKSHVGIVGCGGIGNILSVNLAVHGIGKLTLVDEDIIELSNLSRQILFTEADVGKKKIDVIEREIKKRNPTVEINKVSTRIEGDLPKELINTDLILLSADSSNSIHDTNTFCIKHKIPFMQVCYINDLSCWGPLVVPGETGCWSCHKNIADGAEVLNSKEKEIIQKIDKNFKVPSYGPINMLSANLACLDIFRFLGEFGKIYCHNKRIALDTTTLEFYTQNFKKNKHCIECGIKNE